MQDSQTEQGENSNKLWLSCAIVFCLLAFAFSIAANQNTVDLDLFHEISLVRQALSEDKFPTTDDFAYTPTVNPVVHHEWGTGAVLFTVIKSLGFKSQGLMFLKYLLVVLICLGCYLAARLRGVSLWVFAPCAGLALMLGGQIGFTTIRAQLFTMFFLTVQFMFLELDRQGQKQWILPWLMMVVVWANMHAGIVSGLGIFGFYVVFRFVDGFLGFNKNENSSDDSPEPQPARSFLFRIAQGLDASNLMLWTLVASFALLAANPYGLDLPKYLFYGVSLDRPTIGEWAPLFKAGLDPTFYGIFVASMILAIIAFSKSWSKHLFEAFVVALTAYLALKHVRHLSIYAVTWACIVPGRLMPTMVGDSLDRLFKPLSNKFAVCVAIIGLLFSVLAINQSFWKLHVPTGFENDKTPTLRFPVGAVNHLKRSRFQGNLMVPFISGAFVSWNLYPQVKVSIDSRYEVAYPPESLIDNECFYNAEEGWQAILSKHDTHAVLVPASSKVSEKMSETDWDLHYQDPAFSIYFRNFPIKNPVISETSDFEWDF